MPNDLYQWHSAGGSGAGGLVHHCPQCFKPLNTPKAKGRCLGKHVEQCKRYHTQLFKKGTSSQCDPCNREDEEHLKRHREIAELLHELKQVKLMEVSLRRSSPLKSRAINIVPDSPLGTPESNPMTKKERKAVKKARKHSEMPKALVTSADIRHVASVLDPNNLEAEADLERQLLDDLDIKLNSAFHAGTSNRREIRLEFVVKDKRTNKKDDLQVDPDELAGILQLLNVSPLTTTSSTVEKALHEKLKTCIEHHLINVHNETEALMMRKAGFWRWASKKAYKRLVSNGRIRNQKSGSSTSATSPQDSASSSFDKDDSTEPDTDITTPEQEDGDIVTSLESTAIGVEEHIISAATSKPNITVSIKQSKQADVEAGWTTVGKVKPTKAPTGTITLTHNNGLINMASPVPSAPRRRGFATSYDALY